MIGLNKSHLTSDSYTEADVILEWLNDDPMEINEGEVSLPQFQLLNITTGRCEEKYTTGRKCRRNTGEIQEKYKRNTGEIQAGEVQEKDRRNTTDE